MSKLIKLFIIPLFVLTLNTNMKAQSGTISITITDVNSINFAAFANEESLANQPNYLQVNILPEGIDVIVEGRVEWMKNNLSYFQEIAYFKTLPFKSRMFFNSEIGKTDIKEDVHLYNSNLLREGVEIGKPTGTIRINLKLLSTDGSFINEDSEVITFLNPTAPAIISPVNGSSNDIGSVIISWTESVGVDNYRIKANYVDQNQSPEEALNAGNPLVDNYDTGLRTNINIREILNRELLPDRNVVIVVKAVVKVIGGEEELQSEPVIFSTSLQTGSSSNQNIQVDPNILQLAELLNGKVSQNFINQLKNGEVTIEQIQITDENNNNVTFNDLLSLLQYLNTNEQSLISIEFTAQ